MPVPARAPLGKIFARARAFKATEEVQARRAERSIAGGANPRKADTPTLAAPNGASRVRAAEPHTNPDVRLLWLDVYPIMPHGQY